MILTLKVYGNRIRQLAWACSSAGSDLLSKKAGKITQVPRLVSLYAESCGATNLNELD
jgi:hypothetical protein